MISEILDRLANASAEQLAYDDGSTTITYFQLELLTNKIARALEPTVANNFDYIFLKTSNRLEFLFSWALCKLGLSHGSYNQAIENLKLGRTLVITDDEKLQSKTHTVMLASQKFLFELASLPDTPYRKQLNENPQRISFTSGSTGNAKAIGFSLDELVERAKLGANHWEGGSLRFFLLGQASLPGQYLRIISVLENTPYLAPSFPKTNLQLIKKHRVDSILASPNQLAELIRAKKDLGATLESLMVVQIAGGKITRELASKLDNHIELVNYYASSEAGPVSIKRNYDPGDDSVGTIVNSVDLQIVDENHNPVSKGQAGQIRIKREPMAPSYLGENVNTSFREGYFYPGDLGYIDNGGELHLTGRISETANIGGVKIDIASMEETLTETNRFKDLAAFVYDDSNGMSSLGLAVVLEKHIDRIELTEEINILLGEKRPSLIMELDEIPRTDSGKVARGQLSQQASNQS